LAHPKRQQIEVIALPVRAKIKREKARLDAMSPKECETRMNRLRASAARNTGLLGRLKGEG